MRNYSVVSKGEYVGKQTSEFLHVDRYIIVRRAHKRQLLLELENCGKGQLTALRLQIEQFDARGKFLGVVNVSADDLQIKPGKFVLKKEIILKNTCVDTFVKVLFAEYGDYKYRLGDNETFAVYEKKKAKKEFDDKAVKQELGKTTHTSSHRNFSAPILVRILSVIVILAAVLVSYFHLNSFKDGKSTFFINNVEYEFIGADVSAGAPVRVVGYAGFGGSSIVIEDEIEGHPVKEIGAKAFVDNKDLTSVKISGDINVADDAFRACTSLKTLVLDGVQKIGNNAFKSCSSLEKVEIINCKEIGAEAFRFSKNLKTLSISSPSSDDELIIGARAFADTGSYDSITINQFVKYGTGVNYFNNVTGVKKLSLKNYNYTPYETEPVNISKPIANLFGSYSVPNIEEFSVGYMDAIPQKIVDRTENTIKSFKVEVITSGEIPANTFENCYSLSQFVIPLSPTKVGDRAFMNTQITSFDASKLVSIGEQAFSGCQELKTFDLRNNTLLGAIPNGAFKNTAKLDSIYIPASVNSIGENSFENSGVREVSFNGNCGVTEIPTSAFSYCQRLAIVNFTDKIETIGRAAFDNCSALKEIALPSNLKAIGDSAFANCSSLKYFNVPSTVNSIGRSILRNCQEIQSITIPFLGESVGAGRPVSYLFSNNSYYFQSTSISPKLTSITITKDTKVGEGAFYELTNLSQIVLSPNTRSISANAFVRNFNLRYLEIPSSVIAIDPYAFEECYRLFEVKNDSSLNISRGEGAGKYALAVYTPTNSVKLPRYTQGGKTYANADNKWYLIDFEAKETLSITELVRGVQVIIPSYLFCGEDVKEVVIGSGVYEVKDYAFSRSTVKKVTARSTNAKMGVGVFESSAIESADLSAWALSHIPEHSFFDCYSLKSVALPNSVQEIGYEAFGYCYSLATINLPINLKSIDNGAFRECDEIKELSLPYGVKKILESAFCGCDRLKTISLPSSILIIEDKAFEFCGSLESLTIPTSVTYIGESIVSYCDNLTSISVPYLGESKGSVGSLRRLFGDLDYGDIPWSLRKVTITLDTTIEDSAFEGCYNIEEVTLPSNTITIGNNAFRDCHSLKKVNLPDSVQKIGDSAFAYCSNLSIETMPSQMTMVGESAFEGCHSLTKVQFGNKLTTIYQRAFYNSGVTELTLPSSLSYLGASAFAYCYQLGVVTINGVSTTATIYSTAFTSCDKLFEIYNLSNWSITVGSSSFGSIASNALIVNKIATAPRLKTETINGLTFKYNDSVCGLVDYAGWESKVELKEYTIGGKKVSSYVVVKYAFDPSDYIDELVITNAVSQIRQFAFSDVGRISLVKFDGAKISVPTYAFDYVGRVIFDTNLVSMQASSFTNRPTVYFNGSSTDWDANPNKNRLINFTPNYYYSKCIHTSGTLWNYNTDGSINTSSTQYKYRVILEPTCSATGKGEYYCDDCGYSSTIILNKIPHAESEGICEDCGAVISTVLNRYSYEEIKDNVLTIKNVSGLPFDFFESVYNRITSSKEEELIMSSIEIIAKRDFTITFGVGYSHSGIGTVKLKTGSTTKTITGDSATTYSFNLAAGEKLTIEFQRTNWSDNSHIYLYNITIA